MVVSSQPGDRDGLTRAGPRDGLLAVGTVYFVLFLAHSIWRTTFHNHVVNNFELDGGDVGLLFSLTYIPGIFAFAIGYAASQLQLYRLLVMSCLLLAFGLFVVSGTEQLSALAGGTLLIAFGFTFFYTVANSACLIGARARETATALGQLKSLGPLAGFTAGTVLLLLFAPGLISDAIRVLSQDDPAGIPASLFRLFSTKPAVDTQLLRALLMVLGGILLLAGWFLGRRLRLLSEGAAYGRLNLRRRLVPYYLLNLLAGCRSAIFQAFALFVMVKQFGLPIHGTAALVMAGYLSSFLGYRAVGRLLRYFSHRRILTLIYLVVAVNFLGFWYLTSWEALTAGQALPGLGTLFLIDSVFFGASVVTDSHLKKTGDPSDYVGDVAAGMTLFSLAAMLMSLLGGVLWQPLGPNAFLLGTLVCLMAMWVGRHLSGEKPAAPGV